MKKIIMCLIITLGLGLAFAPVSRAVDVDFLVSAEVPPANGINIVATPVDADTDVFEENQVDALNFGMLSFDSVNGIYTPQQYFAIDVGVTGGAGSTNVTVSYEEGSMPVGQTEGLGFRTIATFVQITGGPGPEDQTEAPMGNHGPTMLLKDLVLGEDVPSTDIIPGFFRLYVGIYTGGIQAIDNAGGAPFTNGDRSGPYDGTLMISATLI